jgi:three-Cys-motif partner protein
MQRESELIVNDGLPAPEVGAWSETKYRLMGMYDTLFSTGMKDKWGQRVYIDLYAGAGYNCIRDTNRLVAGSPILALTVADPFDKYIFCEQSKELLTTLRERVKRIAPAADVAYVSGDCNAQISAILKEIPPYSKANKVLSLCFVDPFDLSIKFKTIRKLAARYVDFLCLLAVMDPTRAYSHYIDEKSTKVAEFLDKSNWREEWRQAQARGMRFSKFLALQFADQMRTLRYIPPPLYKMKEIRSDEKNSPLYYLALFSRHPLAYQFWNEGLKYSTDQLLMDFNDGDCHTN